MNWLAVFLSIYDAPSCRLRYSRTPLTLNSQGKQTNDSSQRGFESADSKSPKNGIKRNRMSFGGGGLVRVSGGSTVCPYGLVKKSICFYLILLGRKKPDRCLSWSHWHYHKINWKRYSKLKMRHEVGRFSDQIHEIFCRMCVTDYVSLKISPVFIIGNHRRL